MQAEVFFIYHNGEQRGPYTAAQVNHLHRCAFIDDETLYWREGLEQWQPVGQIVLRRKRRNRRLFWHLIAGTILAAVLFVKIFGGVTADRWRELTSAELTNESAWWRARGLIREALPSGTDVQFEPFAASNVTFPDPRHAVVILRGQLSMPGGKSEQEAWRVALRFEDGLGVWAPAPKVGKPPE